MFDVTDTFIDLVYISTLNIYNFPQLKLCTCKCISIANFFSPLLKKCYRKYMFGYLQTELTQHTLKNQWNYFFVMTYSSSQARMRLKENWVISLIEHAGVNKPLDCNLTKDKFDLLMYFYLNLIITEF